MAAEYGAEDPPKRLDAEDLECVDLADVEHWVEVYTELVEFTRSLLETASTPESSVAGGSRSDPARGDLRALMLQAQVQELHLAYWLDRLRRLRSKSPSEGDHPV